MMCQKNLELIDQAKLKKQSDRQRKMQNIQENQELSKQQTSLNKAI